MNRRLLIIALFATSAYAADGVRPVDLPTRLAPLPEGWSLLDENGPQQSPGKCEIGLDIQTSADGPQLFSIRCANGDIPSYGGAYMTLNTSRYRGKRVRISGWLKVTAVESVVSTRYPSAAGEAGLYLGVGSQSGGVRADRMRPRSLKGSTDWEYREFVVDVPKDNLRSMVGFWLKGKGQVWVRDITVEKVSKKVPINFRQDDDPGMGVTLK